MSDVTQFLPRTFRIDKLVKSATISAALCAACLLPISVSAQNAYVASNAGADLSSAPYAGSSQSVSEWPVSQPPLVNYDILANPSFNYQQIERAKAFGLRDGQIARAIAIADKVGIPSGTVLDQVRDGWTFNSIAQSYGISSNWRDPSYDYMLHEYMIAYQSTGKGAIESADSSGAWTPASTSWNSNAMPMQSNGAMMPATVGPNNGQNSQYNSSTTPGNSSSSMYAPATVQPQQQNGGGSEPNSSTLGTTPSSSNQTFTPDASANGNSTMNTTPDSSSTGTLPGAGSTPDNAATPAAPSTGNGSNGSNGVTPGTSPNLAPAPSAGSTDNGTTTPGMAAPGSTSSPSTGSMGTTSPSNGTSSPGTSSSTGSTGVGGGTGGGTTGTGTGGAM